MAKISNLFRWIYGHITGRTTNFKWVIEDKLAGSGIPTSLREIKWLIREHGIRTIVTIKEKPLSSEWFKNNGITGGKIDYFHLSIEDYRAPSLEELDNVVNHIMESLFRWQRKDWNHIGCIFYQEKNCFQCVSSFYRTKKD